MPKPMPGLAIIMGSHPHDGEDEEMPEDMGMSHEEHKKSMDDAADEMFDALKSGNKEHFRMALEAYCDLHKEMPEDEPSDADMHGDEDEEDGDDGSYFK